MNRNFFVSRMVAIFMMLLSASQLQATMNPIVRAAILRGSILLSVGFMISAFLFYFVAARYKIKWGTLQCVVVLIVSYILGTQVIRFFISTVPPVSYAKLVLGFFAVPVTLQISAWILLFRKYGRDAILSLSAVSLVFPIVLILGNLAYSLVSCAG